MYLISRNLYKYGKVTNTSSIQKSSEESVATRNLPILEPIAKDKTYLDNFSSMAANSFASTKVLEIAYSMAFNVRLAFVCTNIHNDQVCKDPMNR